MGGQAGRAAYYYEYYTSIVCGVMEQQGSGTSRRQRTGSTRHLNMQSTRNTCKPKARYWLPAARAWSLQALF